MAIPIIGIIIMAICVMGMLGGEGIFAFNVLIEIIHMAGM